MQDKVHAPRRQEALASKTSRDSHVGFARQSLTTGTGALRLDPIEGVRYRLARPVSHRHGHLTEPFAPTGG